MIFKNKGKPSFKDIGLNSLQTIDKNLEWYKSVDASPIANFDCVRKVFDEIQKRFQTDFPSPCS